MQIAFGLENSSAILCGSYLELLGLKADMSSWLAGRGLLKEYSTPVVEERIETASNKANKEKLLLDSFKRGRGSTWKEDKSGGGRLRVGS